MSVKHANNGLIQGYLMRHFFSEMPNILKSTSLACYTRLTQQASSAHISLPLQHVPTIFHCHSTLRRRDYSPKRCQHFVSVFGQLLLMFNFQQNFLIFSQKSMQVDGIVLFDMINFAEQTTRFLCSRWQ